MEFSKKIKTVTTTAMYDKTEFLKIISSTSINAWNTAKNLFTVKLKEKELFIHDCKRYHFETTLACRDRIWRDYWPLSDLDRGPSASVMTGTVSDYVRERDKKVRRSYDPEENSFTSIVVFAANTDVRRYGFNQN